MLLGWTEEKFDTAKFGQITHDRKLNKQKKQNLYDCMWLHYYSFLHENILLWSHFEDSREAFSLLPSWCFETGCDEQKPNNCEIIS